MDESVATFDSVANASLPDVQPESELNETLQPPHKLNEVNDSQPQSTESVEDAVLDADDNHQLVVSVERVLQHQEKQARQDITKLIRLRNMALADPEAYVRGLLNNTIETAPRHQAVPSVPQIDFRVYSAAVHGRKLRSHSTAASYFQPEIIPAAVSLDTVTSVSSIKAKPQTSLDYFRSVSSVVSPPADVPSRRKLNNEGSSTPSSPSTEFATARSKRALTDDDEIRKPKISRSVSTSAVASTQASPSQRKAVSSTDPSTPPPHPNYASKSNPKTHGTGVKGRVYEPGTNTFGLPWSEEEQRQLEELLLIYPDEEIHARRCDKISKALGTRTSLQVASRIQKHFIRLAKENKPIPGRMNYDFAHYKAYVKPADRHRHRSSQAHEKKASRVVRVKSSDEEDNDSKRERPARPLKSGDGSTEVVHDGYKCDGCETEPIVGVRWKCLDCDELDLCDTCHRNAFSTGFHVPSHRFEQYSQAEAPYYLDDDYSSIMGEYNYLDPNFNPQ